MAQPNRSSTEDQLRELTEAIDRIRTASGAPRLVLIGLSRGGNAIRNYVSTPERAANVSHVVLCGTPITAFSTGMRRSATSSTGAEHS